MFLRGPYVIVPRNPKYTETQYQFSNWYHFSLALRRRRAPVAGPQHGPRRLDPQGGDAQDVLRAGRPVGLLRRAATATCSTTTRRSTSTPAGRGSTPCAARKTAATATPATSSWARKGTCYLGSGQIEGENPWQFKGPAQQPLRRRAEGPDRLGPQRQAHQQRLPHGPQHAGDGGWGSWPATRAGSWRGTRWRSRTSSSARRRTNRASTRRRPSGPTPPANTRCPSRALRGWARSRRSGVDAGWRRAAQGFPLPRCDTASIGSMRTIWSRSMSTAR